MPPMVALPKVGRKVSQPMRRDDLEALLAASSPPARLAFEVAAFAGLRASEVRGLRWSDVDLRARTLTVRRGITLGIETTPKSHHHRVVPLATRLLVSLEAAGPQDRPLVAGRSHGTRQPVGRVRPEPGLQASTEARRSQRVDVSQPGAFLRDGALPTGRSGGRHSAASRALGACDHPALRRRRWQRSTQRDRAHR
jgi:integrase